MLPKLFLAALAASLAAQDNSREVGEGRETRDAKLLTPGQTDTWAIDVKADEVLRCRVTSQQLDPVLELVDAAGSVLRSDDGKGSQSYIEYRASEPGKLAFRVSGYRGGGGGRYEFWLERYVAPKTDVGRVVTGKFGKERWAHVRLDLEKGERVVAVASGGTLRHMVRFGDAQQSAMPSRMSTYTADAHGEYHLRIEGHPGHGYRLVTQRPTCRSLAIDQLLEADIDPWAVDIVRIEVPADVAMSFELDTPMAPLHQAHHALGEQPSWHRLHHWLKGGCSRDLFWSRDGAAVELWLHNASDRAACYAFAARTAEAVLARPRHSGDLPLGSLQCHTIEAQAGEVVSLLVSSKRFDPCLRLFDPTGQILEQVDDRGLVDRAASTTFHAKRSGTYRAVVYTPGLVGSGDYEVGSVRHEVPALEFGKTLPLSCDPSSDAYAHLQLAKGQEVWLSARSAQVDCAISLVDDRGKHYGTWESGGIGGDVLQAFRAERAGTLTVFLHARSGQGTCSLRAVAVE